MSLFYVLVLVFYSSHTQVIDMPDKQSCELAVKQALDHANRLKAFCFERGRI